MAATPANAIAVPTEPISSSFLRPTRSMTLQGEDGRDQIGGAHRHLLQVIGQTTEARGREDVLEVVENRIDAGELVEHCDQDARAGWVCDTRRRIAAPRGTEARMLGRALEFREHRITVDDADPRETGLRFVVAPTLRQPARTLRNRVHHDEEHQRRDRGDPEFHAPGIGAVRRMLHQRIAHEREQDAEHDVELEQAREPAAPIGRRDLGNVNRREHRRRADREAADEAEHVERFEVPAERAAQRRHDVHEADRLERIARAITIAGRARRTTRR